MSFWEILNSPILLTVISIVGGGILVTAISTHWQNKSRKHSVRLSLAQSIFDIYYEYIRYLNKEDLSSTQNEFDKIHSSFLSKARISKAIFNDKISKDLVSLSRRLATLRDLRIRKKTTHFYNQMQKLHIYSNEIFENVFNNL